MTVSYEEAYVGRMEGGKGAAHRIHGASGSIDGCRSHVEIVARMYGVVSYRIMYEVSRRCMCVEVVDS